MSEIRACSLSKVAREAGVAKSTASLALRGSPRVLAATIARVTAVAEKLGYRPDPRVGSLMVRIRQSRELHDREQLAFVWVGATREGSRRDRFSAMSFAGAKRRAEELGCGLEEFFLNDEGMTAPRLGSILVARGITGVVFSAPHYMMEVRLDLRWENFATARIGSTDFYPALHRVETNHFGNMRSAMLKLREAGCRRPVAVLFELIHRRFHGVHQAAFIVNHPTLRPSLGMTRFDLPSARGETMKWLEKLKADGIVFVMNPPDETLRWLRTLPQLKCMVTLDIPKEQISCMSVRPQMIGAKAVDLVIAQLHRNERGVPRHPTTVLLDGEWSDQVVPLKGSQSRSP